MDDHDASSNNSLILCLFNVADRIFKHELWDTLEENIYNFNKYPLSSVVASKYKVCFINSIAYKSDRTSFWREFHILQSFSGNNAWGGVNLFRYERGLI